MVKDGLSINALKPTLNFPRFSGHRNQTTDEVFIKAGEVQEPQ